MSSVFLFYIFALFRPAEHPQAAHLQAADRRGQGGQHQADRGSSDQVRNDRLTR